MPRYIADVIIAHGPALLYVMQSVLNQWASMDTYALKHALMSSMEHTPRPAPVITKVRYQFIRRSSKDRPRYQWFDLGLLPASPGADIAGSARLRGRHRRHISQQVGLVNITC